VVVFIIVLVLIVWGIWKAVSGAWRAFHPPPTPNSCSYKKDKQTCTSQNGCEWDDNKCKDESHTPGSPCTGSIEGGKYTYDDDGMCEKYHGCENPEHVKIGDKCQYTPGSPCTGSIEGGKYTYDNDGMCKYHGCKNPAQVKVGSKCQSVTKCETDDCDMGKFSRGGDHQFQNCFKTDDSDVCIRLCSDGALPVWYDGGGYKENEGFICKKESTPCSLPEYDQYNVVQYSRREIPSLRGAELECVPKTNDEGIPVCKKPYSHDDSSIDQLNCKNIRMKFYSKKGHAGTPATYDSWTAKNKYVGDREHEMSGEGQTSKIINVPLGGKIKQYCHGSAWSKYGKKNYYLSFKELEDMKHEFKSGVTNYGNNVNTLSLIQCQKGDPFF